MANKSSIGNEIIEFTELDSTNNYAMTIISRGMAEHGLTIRADYQTKGKGQRGNVWLAEESKNLLVSFILDMKSENLSNVFLLNCAFCEAIAELLMVQFNLKNVSIKWPNDIIVDNKKIAGVLIENILQGADWQFAILGLGLNVNQTSFEISTPITSMKKQTTINYNIKDVMKKLIAVINVKYKLFLNNKEQLILDFNQHLYKRNEQALILRKNILIDTKVIEVKKDGKLVLEENGKLTDYQHKEIEWLLE